MVDVLGLIDPTIFVSTFFGGLGGMFGALLIYDHFFSAPWRKVAFASCHRILEATDYGTPDEVLSDIEFGRNEGLLLASDIIADEMNERRGTELKTDTRKFR